MEKSSNSSLLIFTRQKSSRLSYILDVLFGHILQFPFQTTTDNGFFQNWKGPKINYSSEAISQDEIWLAPSTLLFSQGIKTMDPQVIRHNGVPAAFFHKHTEADLPFDPFAFCFYLISRYEEYTASEMDFDSHGRFKATASLAYQHQFLDQAVVNQWMLYLKNNIAARWPQTTFPNIPFQYIPTYDIDLAWAYRERPFWRMLGGSLRDLAAGKRDALLYRWKVLTQKKKDPFDTYHYLQSLHTAHALKPIFFFLLANPSRYDRNISPRNPQLKQLIQTICEVHPVGIHPSYQSHEKPVLLKTEIGRLAAITQKPVDSSRFHFLKFRLPVAYRRLLQAGILHDYSMGYASQAGFRAGIATAYPWYDLEKEAPTPLMIHPFAIMDGTLKNYLGFSPNEGLEVVKNLIQHTASVKGTFITLWHNSSFSYIEGWEKWKEMYEELLKYCHKH
jgi:hypothetical protein